MLAARLAQALDVEGKIPRALETLGPMGGRDVALVDAPDGIRARQLTDLGARVTPVTSTGAARFDAPDRSADAVVALWSSFRGTPSDEIAEAARMLRPGGRLLVVHDYGRDDVAGLHNGGLDPGLLSRRDGPFLSDGFRIRVLHCWWTFASLEEGRGFLTDAFGDAGRELGERLTRPRVSHKVAVYHRTFGEAQA
jgi:SAM-dependent methyltransferase